jgi:hypothetical protein
MDQLDAAYSLSETGATQRMLAIPRERRKQVLAAAIGFAALIVSLSRATAVQAGILFPQQADFTADDLERSLTESAGAGSTSGGSDSQPEPSHDDSEPHDLLGLQQANLPSGGGSTGGSSTSSSSSGGSTSASAIGWSVNNTIAVADESTLGRLAEDHGLSLPEPPGTLLLRPPRV